MTNRKNKDIHWANIYINVVSKIVNVCFLFVPGPSLSTCLDASVKGLVITGPYITQIY